LRACLTASNGIDLDMLNSELVKQGLNLNDKRIDPKTAENQTKIKDAIKEQFIKHGSLVTVLGENARGKGVEILGAQASITAHETESVLPTGELAVIPATGIPVDQQDPHVAGSKVNYVRFGKEPTGTLKAVIESWAINHVECFEKMDERILTPAATDDEFSIHLLFRTILTGYKTDILAANNFVTTAGLLHDLARGGDECRVSRLQGDTMMKTHYAAFYAAMVGKFANNNAVLVIYESWMQADTSKRVNFVTQLGDVAFDKNKADKYLEYTVLDKQYKPIFDGDIGSERGRILLALTGFIYNKHPDCKAYLLKQKDINNKLLPKLTAELKGYSEDTLRKNLGLPVEAAPMGGAGGGGLPQKNIAVPQNYYVEPMRPTTFVGGGFFSSTVRIRKYPDNQSDELQEFKREAEFIIVGKVKDIASGSDVGRYMVKRSNGTIGYVSSASIKEKK